MKKTSLSDIARQLGVSKTLVSLVLNGKAKEHRISDNICRKVISLAEELNYKPNQIAKGLRTGRTNTIGLIIADIANPFFGKLGREIEKEAATHGYRVMFCSSDEKAENSKKQIEMLLQGQVDGFIISPPAGSEAQIIELGKSKKPYVLIDRHFPDIESNYVTIDNFQAAYEGTMHLINQGYKKIACITINMQLVNMKQRVDGLKKALVDAAIPIKEERIIVLPFSHEMDDVFRAVKIMFYDKRERPDAILFTTSKIGVMGLESIHSLGLKIPGDVAVVSFDDPDTYKISQPPISAIAQPLKEIGCQSVKILLEQLSSRKSKPTLQKVVLKTNFIARKSSER